MMEVALVGYCILMVAVGDCNVVIVVVAFCKLLFGPYQSLFGTSGGI